MSSDKTNTPGNAVKSVPGHPSSETKPLGPQNQRAKTGVQCGDTKMKRKFSVVAFGTAMLLALPAIALDLSHDDEDTYTVDVIGGQGDESKEQFVLEPGEILSNICEGGCTIVLDSGAQQIFNGDETAPIRNGEFVINE